MKVVAFNGSARKDGNTSILINLVLDELQKEGIETELFQSFFLYQSVYRSRFYLLEHGNRLGQGRCGKR